jgi:hypothetical protein
MGNINVGRVILGGLLAGLVINIGETVLNLFVVAQGMDHALKARNLPPVGGGAIAGTAAMAGLAVWFFAYLYKDVGQDLMGFFPAGLTILTLVWGLVEILAGALAGGWLYNEE